jgi:hypothetical protein
MKSIKAKLNLLIKRIYVVSFNVYSFYWLYKLIYIHSNTTWEDYLLYFFTVAGMHFFVLDGSKDLFIKK